MVFHLVNYFVKYVIIVVNLFINFIINDCLFVINFPLACLTNFMIHFLKDLFIKMIKLKASLTLILVFFFLNNIFIFCYYLINLKIIFFLIFSLI